ncbi:MAG: hypothetical protein ABSE57_18870 [Bryobacteraceae bacterium]
MRRLSLAALAVILFCGMTAAAQNISIQFEGSAFKVTGWQAPPAPPAKGWASVFVIYAGPGDVPALLGGYTVESGSLVFHPTYPIAAGVHYRAIFKAPSGGAPIEKTFDGPPRPTNRIARVERVYPSGDVWPSNQLRLYIYFSAPMSRAEAASHIHVLDSGGKELVGSHAVFLPGEELWEPGYKRLTMTFDPGRIKRGLTSNENIGPPLTEGKRYTLVIDADWPDARGVPMAEGFRKAFRSGPAERVPPDPKRWTVTAPKAGNSAALVIDFPTPMNYPLLQRMLQVSGPGGMIYGAVAIGRQESEWLFVPQHPWAAGDYQLIVDTGLEDLAGNHIGEPFDIDVFTKVTEHIETKTISLPFHVR